MVELHYTNSDGVRVKTTAPTAPAARIMLAEADTEPRSTATIIGRGADGSKVFHHIKIADGRSRVGYKRNPSHVIR